MSGTSLACRPWRVDLMSEEDSTRHRNPLAPIRPDHKGAFAKVLYFVRATLSSEHRMCGTRSQGVRSSAVCQNKSDWTTNRTTNRVNNRATNKPTSRTTNRTTNRATNKTTREREREREREQYTCVTACMFRAREKYRHMYIFIYIYIYVY